MESVKHLVNLLVRPAAVSQIKTARTKTTKDFSEEGAVCRHSSFFSPLIETLSLGIDYLYALIIFMHDFIYALFLFMH